MVSVVDYGVANIGSLLNMLRRSGEEVRAVADPAEVLSAEKLILPGVGAFDNGMRHLREQGLAEPVVEAVTEHDIPLLGICLGMQLLGRGSEEGNEPGLGLVPAVSVRFRFPEGSPFKVPHQGWNKLSLRRPTSLVDEQDPQTRFYFSHSYHLVCDSDDDVLATADYGGPFTAMVQRRGLHGAQFHPEKSHVYGMRLLKTFAGL